MMAQNKNWTREELILALNLYLKLPFGKMHSNTPEIIHLAGLLHRTPGSIAMRLSNFASVDPFHQQRGVSGLPGGRKQVEPIWNEFNHNREELIFESERILAEKENISLEEKYSPILQDLPSLHGDDKLRQVKTRVNQNIFRQMVLANYSSTCAISGINIPDLLVASHILPWAKDKQARLNPENGICLSALYDKAYDRGYISIQKNMTVIVSKSLKKQCNQPMYERWFAFLPDIKINPPGKWKPAADFLEYHLDVIFKG